MMLLVFLLFPISKGYRNRPCGGTSCARCSASRPSRTCSRAATSSGIVIRCPIRRTCSRCRRSSCRAGGVPAHVGLDHGVRHLASPRVCVVGPWLPRLVAAPRLRHRRHDRLPVPDARGNLRTAVDVSSTLIILFTIYGAFLQQSGAGKFSSTGASRRWAASRPARDAPWCCRRSCWAARRSAWRRRSRIGSVAYSMLERAGYGKDAAGGLPAAGGLGAIISPPVLGAAALPDRRISQDRYLDVLLMATIPTLLVPPVAVPDGGDRRAQVGMPAVAVEGRVHSGCAHEAVLVRLRVADLDRRVHAARLPADLVGVLRDDRDLRRVVPAPRHRDGLQEARDGAQGRFGPDAERRRHVPRRPHHRGVVARRASDSSSARP